MKIVQCSPADVLPEVIQEAVDVLLAGGVVVHPTDTCYGLAADISNPEALKRLYELKGMPEDKPVSALVSSLEAAQRYGVLGDMSLRLARDFWPGPLTLVVPKTKEVPAIFSPSVDTIGLRVIDEPVTVAMLELFGGAVTTTSANLHGKPSPFRAEDVTAKADLLIDVGSLKKHEKPSTVIEVKDGKATVIRQGDLFLLSL